MEKQKECICESCGSSIIRYRGENNKIFVECSYCGQPQYDAIDESDFYDE